LVHLLYLDIQMTSFESDASSLTGKWLNYTFQELSVFKEYFYKKISRDRIIIKELIGMVFA
jgi:hypothetical protein